MKPFNIDVETIEGSQILGPFIEISGTMTVHEELTPLEGVHQSLMRMNEPVARALHGRLTEALAAIERRRRQAGGQARS